MRERLSEQPENARIVIRANAKALGMTSEDLGKELDSALHRAWKKYAHKVVSSQPLSQSSQGYSLPTSAEARA